MDGLAAHVTALLDEIQKALLARALTFREEHTTRVASYDEFKSAMEGRPGFVIAAWCGSEACEAEIKAETQATLRNIPFGGETSVECASNAASRRSASRGLRRRINQLSALSSQLSAKLPGRSVGACIQQLIAHSLTLKATAFHLSPGHCAAIRFITA